MGLEVQVTVGGHFITSTVDIPTWYWREASICASTLSLPPPLDVQADTQLRQSANTCMGISMRMHQTVVSNIMNAMPA